MTANINLTHEINPMVMSYVTLWDNKLVIIFQRNSCVFTQVTNSTGEDNSVKTIFRVY